MPRLSRQPKAAPRASKPHFDNDPDIEFGTKTFLVTVGDWRYRAEFRVTVAGNTRGFDCFDTAVEAAWESITTKHPSFDGDDDDPGLREFAMKDCDGNTLTNDMCSLDEFKEMVVSVVQIGVMVVSVVQIKADPT